MLGIILGLILLAAGTAVIVGLGVKWKKAEGEAGSIRLGFILGGVLLLLVAVSSCAGIKQMDAQQYGVVTRFGAPTGRVLTQGANFVVPFADAVQVMNGQTLAYDVDAEAASKDLQDVHTKITVNYHLEPSKVVEIYSTLRQDSVDRIMRPAIQEAVKAVTALYDADELIEKRELVKGGIDTGLKARVESLGLTVTAVSITDFDFSESFNAAIEAKVTAVQQAEEARNRLVQVQIEAEQAAARAKGEADANIARATGAKTAAITNAEGEAQAIEIVAAAQAAANKLIAGSLSDSIIRYTVAQALAPGIRTVVLPSGSDFILGSEVLGESEPSTIAK